MRLTRVRRLSGPLALLALAVAAAYPMQINGWNQTSHYALVRALADGTPTIDKSRGEVGDVGVGDASIFDGHYYSNKAPGLAFVTLPAFLALDAAGMRTTGDPTRVIWALHLWSLVPAFVILLVLVRRLAEWLEPGFGTAAAVAFGLGTLVLPFSTLFFAHVLSAMLGFAAFAVLWRERQGAPRLLLVGAAGLLAGLAVTTEYSLVLVGIIVGVYALARGNVVRRASSYAAGVVVGVLPLMLYNAWAFGSVFHSSYEGNQTGALGGFFGIKTPRMQLLFDALFSAWGLLPLTPVVACGLVGAAIAYRRGVRPEALVIAGVVVVHLIWAACFRAGINIFGGLGPPRYLMMIFPFLAVPLGVAFRAIPLTTLALAAVSAFQMVVITATNPLASYDGDWLERLTARDVSQTAASIVGVTGWYTILVFFAAVFAGLVCAAFATSRIRVPPWELVLALAGLLAWGLIAVAASNPAGHGFSRSYVLAFTLGLSVALLGLARLYGTRPPPRIGADEMAVRPSPR
jgi:hypothetical protein